MNIRRKSGKSDTDTSLSSGKGFFPAVVNVGLCLYAAIWVFIWFYAYLTPGPAVLVRLAASILSDLIWIPFGFALWFMICNRFLERVLRLKNGLPLFLCRIASGAAVTVFFICCYDKAFLCLFIPLTCAVVYLAVSFFSSETVGKNTTRHIPYAFLIFLTVFTYRWQLIPAPAFRNDNGDIKVMSYNIFAHADYEDRLYVFETIKSEFPDVICFMEFNPMRDPNLFKQELGDTYPHMLMGDNLTRWTKSAACIYSKYPIKKIKVEKISEKGDRHVNFIFAEMNVHGRNMNIINYHLITVGHRIERAARKSFGSKELVDRATVTEAEIDEEKFHQVHYLLDKISTFREPTILCGDLNDTPNSRAYRLLEKQFTNAFSAKGWGLGSTFGERWMKSRFRKIPVLPRFARDVMRIDHIFVSKDIEVVSSRVIDAKGSDHKPIVTIVRLTEE